MTRPTLLDILVPVFCAIMLASLTYRIGNFTGWHDGWQEARKSMERAQAETE